MILRRIRQFLTVCFLTFLIIGAISLWYRFVQNQEEKKKNQATVVKEEARTAETIDTSNSIEEIEESNLRSYLGHTKQELEQKLGLSFVDMEVNGVQVLTTGADMEYILLSNEDRIKGILLGESSSNLSYDSIKIGDRFQEKEEYLEQNYSYYNYFIEGEKWEFYKKTNTDIVVAFSINKTNNQIEAILSYMEDFEDPILKWALGGQNGVKWEYTGYILEKSSEESIEVEILERLSYRELILAKSEIYARHGYVFEEENIQKVFERTEWYVPNQNNHNFSESIFNQYEKENIKRIESIIEEKTSSE